MEALVTGHPAPTRAAVNRLRAPARDVGLPHGFMYLRLAYLRGFEGLMLDFADEPPELSRLIDLVLRYNLRQLENLRRPDRGRPGLVVLGDDLGLQRSLPISPTQWRRWLKPCFAQVFGACRRAGHWVYLHSDGHILEIIPDLVECGANVLNPQVGANGLGNLAAACKGKVCVDLDLDRQRFPFWTPAEIDAHVRAAVEQLGDPNGGLWLKAEISPDVPLRNVEAICTALEKYRGYFQG
jgi:hypothetical protein